MISVIIPLYNKEKYVANTITSVLYQTFQDFEIIVVNDGSTDNSVAEVEKFKDPRIRIIHQKNSGVSTARNRGIKKAKYELIAFLDADDLWECDFLEKIHELKIKYNSCSIFATNYKVMTNNTLKSIIINGLSYDFKEGILNNYFKIASKSDPIICSSAVVIRKNAIEKIGGFPEGIKAGEDLLTWARLAANFDIAYSLEEKAYFCRWEVSENKKPRIPDPHDKVGDELRKLLIYGDKNRIEGLEEYIAYWHKIRLSIFLRLGEIDKAREEFRKMSEFANKDLKFYLYAGLVYSPKWITKKLNNFIFNLNNYRRNLYIKFFKEK
jgi:glycosyltransferase involved in cell wall biosynthesis